MAGYRNRLCTIILCPLLFKHRGGCVNYDHCEGRDHDRQLPGPGRSQGDGDHGGREVRGAGHGGRQHDHPHHRRPGEARHR